MALVTGFLIPAAVVGTAAVASASVANPVVTGPVTTSCNPSCPSPPGPANGIHVPPEFDGQTALPDLAAHGYVESEYFFAGTANAFQRDAAAAAWDASGVWTAKPSTTIAPAAYKSRMLVIEPSDPTKFNGTVVVEWLNVTAGFESAADFAYAHDELLRDGYIYVGVSVQAVGINGGTPAGYGLKSYDPVRYGSLVHPGDNFSYDIFSQAGQAIKSPSGVNPLGSGYTVQHVIADGESQSATRMVTYIDAIQPLAQVYDGFFVHSRGATGAALFTGTGGTVPSNSKIRTDQVPVLVFEAETDTAGHFAARQPDSANYRLWEGAGTAHADLYSTNFGAQYLAGQIPAYPPVTCDKTYNSADERYLVNAAMSRLNDWASTGALPASAAPITVVSNAIVRDSYGIATGGIRLPEMDVPTKVTSGVGNTPGLFCSLFGTTTALPVSLSSLYSTHAAYVSSFTNATNALATAGFILAPDAADAISRAGASTVGLTAPGAPSVTGVTPGNTTVTVAFAPPGSPDDSAITSYTATCTDGAAASTSQSGPASPITVGGLTNGTDYTCTVTATNPIGPGATSGPSSVVAPRTVPGAPSITSVAGGNHTVGVAFSPPASNGGSTVTGYTARCSDGAASNGTQTGAASPITVGGLTNGTAYTCTVTATNAAGDGSPSGPSASVVPYTKPGAPSITGVTPGNHTIGVAFSPPASNGGSPITSYTATCTSGATNASESGASSPLTVGGLTNGAAYTCTVTATNPAGDGPASASSAATTPDTVPGAPSITGVTPGNGSIAVAFAAPVPNGGTPITGYSATCTHGPSSASQTGTGSPIVVGGLTPAVVYRCTATATNAFGDGAPSSLSAPVTPYAVPDAPSITQVTGENQSVVVAFSAPASNGAPISAYTATCSDGGSSHASQTGGGSPITVSGLVNNASYTCTAFATNVAGNGPASAPSALVTPLGPATAVVSAASNTNTVEGNSGSHTVTVPVALTGIHGAVSVQWQTVNGSVPSHSAIASIPARSTDDYVGASGTLTYSPSQFTGNMTLTIKGDTKLENSESFVVLLSTTSPNTVLQTSSLTVTILNDERPKLLVSNGGSVFEGTAWPFSVSISNDYYAPIAVAVASASTTACESGGTCSPVHFVSVDGVVTIPAGSRGPLTVSLATLVDHVSEKAQAVKVSFGSSAVSNKTIVKQVKILANTT